MENVFTNFSGGLQLRCIDIEADNGLSQSAIIANNIFSSQNTANGYGVYIAVYSGIYCLDFVNNKASPTSSPNPYFFTQVGGVFNLSSQSTQQNNIGTIQTQGAVGSPGSCSH
jgi:hypothetical protein